MTVTISDYDSLSKQVAPLVKYWAPRNKQMKEWYKLIQLKDELATADMESFVGNDPRSSFNLILHMLDVPIPHRIPTELITVDNLAASGQVETLFARAWRDVHKTHRKSGKESWMRTFLGFLLATGWYSVFAQLTPDGTKCSAHIFNPYSVYPNWDGELFECARVFTLPPAQANNMVKRAGWSTRQPFTKNVDGIDFWYLDDGGKPHNIVSLSKEIVKTDKLESRFNEVGIPILVGPCGGLPDDGLLTSDVGDLGKEVGQSIVATNEKIYKSWNKWWTFSMQLLRDTAQPRWFEKSRSGKPILDKINLFKRGSIFRGTPEDSVEALQVPAIPVEIRGNQLDMEAMMERGGVSWAAQGNFRGQLTSYVMAQVIASTAQVARPFHQAAQSVMGDIDNIWWSMIKTTSAKPYDFKMPTELDDWIEITADYEIEIPGDLIQRATSAKMLDPQFVMPFNYILGKLFPEVKNPAAAKAMIRADEAQRLPANAMIAAIDYFKKEAQAKGVDPDVRRLFLLAAQYTEQQMQQVVNPQGQQVQAAAQGQVRGGGQGGQAPGVTNQQMPQEMPRFEEEQ